MTPKHPDIIVALAGHDGNAFSVLGRCRKAAQEVGLPEDEIPPSWPRPWRATTITCCKPPCAGSMFAEGFIAHGPVGHFDPGCNIAHALTPSLSATSSNP